MTAARSIITSTTSPLLAATLVAVVAAVVLPGVSLPGVSLPAVRAAEPDAVALSSDPFRRDKVDDAVDKAIAYLVSKQDKAGWINENHSNATAMTSLAIMAMAAVGHQPSDNTTEGRAMRKALEYVLDKDRQDERGYFGNRDGSRMYGHGIITLMLAEMLGMGVDEEMDQIIAQRLQRAVNLILKSQRVRKDPRNAGGWRYAPDSGDSDLSVTVWQVMALRSAKNAGMDVPGDAIKSAVEYINRCYRGDPRQARGGEASAFAYQPGGSPDYATASAGLLSMQVCGQYEAPSVAAASDWLLNQKLNYGHQWFFYGTYYYAQGMFQRAGKHAEAARQRVADVLLGRQGKDGSWRAQSGQESGAGRVYATSLAVLSLSVKYHYLPIYQR